MQHEVGQREVGNGDYIHINQTYLRDGDHKIRGKSHAACIGLCEVDNGDCTLNGPTSEMVIMKSG